MTHGNVWIPLNGQVLYCEAWSDGYLDGVGFGALCSSQKISTISKLSEIFYGSPFFYEPSTGSYIAKEGDYIIEGYGDVMEDESLVEDAEKTLELVLNGDLESAFKTRFAQLSFNERMELDIGINAELNNYEDEWNSVFADCKFPSLKDACQLVVQQYKNDPDFEMNEAGQYNYFWKDGQFWINIEIEDELYVMPLMIACAFSCSESNVYGDIEYLKDMVDADKKTLITLRDTLLDNNMSINQLFNNAATELIKNLV